MTAQAPEPLIARDRVPARVRLAANNPEFYDTHWRHNRTTADPYVVGKAAELRALVPAGVRSVADIGCGDGTVSAALAREFDVLAVDRSEIALAHLARVAPQVRRLRSDAAALELPDGAVDLVLSSELLEHLEPPVRQQAAREMMRISRRWLLVSVPDREVLEHRSLHCPQCGLDFHAYGHLASLDQASLAALFPGFAIRRVLRHGRPVNHYHPALERARRRAAGQDFAYPGLRASCPSCGNEQFPVAERGMGEQVLGGVLDAAEWLWQASHGSRSRPFWLTLLLERAPEEQDSSSAAADVGATVAGRAGVAALESLRFLALLRLLDKPTYGTLALVLAWHASALALGTLALPDALMVRLPQLPAPQQAWLIRLSLRLAAAVGGLLGGVALVAWCSGAAGPGVRAFLPWLAVAIALELPAQLLQGTLLGLRRHGLAARRSLLAAAGVQVVVLLGAVAGAAWLGPALAASAALRLLVTLWTLRPVLHAAPAERAPDGLRGLLAIVLPLSASGLLGTANRQLAAWALGAVLPAAVFADFALGSQELPVVALLPNAVAIALVPRLAALQASGRTPDALALWHASLARVALVMLPLWLWCTLEAPSLLAVLGGPAWAPAALPFRITALLLPLRLTSYGAVLTALGGAAQVLRAHALGLFATLAACGLALAAAPRLPPTTVLAIGSSAFVASQVVAVAALLYALAGRTQTSLAQILPWRDLGARGLVAALAVLGVGLGFGPQPAAALAPLLVRGAATLVAVAGAFALAGWLRRPPA